MSIRKVIKYGEDSLREHSKEVHKVSQKIKVLVEDLLDTMYAQNGVGLAAPTPEWGLILNDGKAYMTQSPYMMVFPAGMIMITCFAFNLMGDGLRDAFDPKMK